MTSTFKFIDRESKTKRERLALYMQLAATILIVIAAVDIVTTLLGRSFLNWVQTYALDGTAMLMLLPALAVAKRKTREAREQLQKLDIKLQVLIVLRDIFEEKARQQESQPEAADGAGTR